MIIIIALERLRPEGEEVKDNPSYRTGFKGVRTSPWALFQTNKMPKNLLD